MEASGIGMPTGELSPQPTVSSSNVQQPSPPQLQPSPPPLLQQQQQQQQLAGQLKFTTIDGRGRQNAAAGGAGGAGGGPVGAAEIDLDFNILAKYLAEEVQFGECTQQGPTGCFIPMFSPSFVFT